MQSFIAIHSTDNGPFYTSFDTIQGAKMHLQMLIRTDQVEESDALAIVRASDDGIIYFKQRNNTVASIETALNKRRGMYKRSTRSVYQSVKERLQLVFTSLTNAVSRR